MNPIILGIIGFVAIVIIGIYNINKNQGKF